jgi:hypothetical protein
VEGQEEVVVGQPVTVIIEVLVPTFFRGAPAYDPLDVEDAIAFFNDRGTNFTERRDGATWAGQRRSYTIYPSRAGTYAIPTLGVEVRYGVGSRAVIDTAFADPVSFAAVIPEEAQGGPAFVAARELRLSQRYEPVPDTIRVGDAFRRTITTEVDGTLSLIVPPLSFDSIDGLAVYPDPPRLTDDGGERGTSVTGQRVESAAYVAQVEGTYRLPPVAVAWWDWSERAMRRSEVPGVALVVVANPDLVAEYALPPDSVDVAMAEAEAAVSVGLGPVLRLWLIRVGSVGLLLFVTWRLLAPRLSDLRRTLEAGRTKRAESERAHFRRLQQAARTNDPGATANALAAWLTRFQPTSVRPTWRTLVQLADSDELTHALTQLDSVLYGRRATSATWSGVELARQIDRARTRLSRRQPGGASPPGTDDLLPLNPQGG